MFRIHCVCNAYFSHALTVSELFTLEYYNSRKKLGALHPAPPADTKRKHMCYDKYYLSSMGDARKDLPQTIITT